MHAFIERSSGVNPRCTIADRSSSAQVLDLSVDIQRVEMLI